LLIITKHTFTGWRKIDSEMQLLTTTAKIFQELFSLFNVLSLF